MDENKAKEAVVRMFGQHNSVIQESLPEERGRHEESAPVRSGPGRKSRKAETNSPNVVTIQMTGQLAAEFEKRRVEIFNKTGKIPTRTDLIRILLGK